MNLESYIKNEVEKRNITMFYQKLIKENGPCAYECLARLENNTSISPEVFIPIIIKLKLYEDFTKIVIKKSFEMFKNKEAFFSINLAYIDLSNKNIFHFLEEQLIKSNLGKYLIIEILEDEIKDFTLVESFIHKLKRYGVQFAIDDFGTRYSNLTHLLHLEADFLKIDIFLIKELCVNSKAKIIVEDLVELANKLNIKVIVEGVENQETYQILSKYKIEAYQGFYFSKPDRELR